jgi:hypothetical protein
MEIYKRGKWWWGRYRGERKSLGIPTGPDATVRRKLAEDAYRNWTLEIDEDAACPGRREERNHTVKDLLDRWMTDHGGELKSATELRCYYKFESPLLMGHRGARARYYLERASAVFRCDGI